ncbi:lipase 3 precursor [Cordyceps militaris CM01]|uniref:Carboxylic ester hydrolase n=1 Tax=Cordyceps militaris (strain CM01) TaxID=983644 RepID=G3JUN1_CORMM|nr:lipase 3 precursor [Cordyceps militaris CM01]EGX87767.1 lipase 3 precursor [Cordyceps militaris CM01]
MYLKNITAHLPRATQKISVELASGTTVIGRSGQGIETFNGIPYADPPVGPLRFKPPQKISRKLEPVDATGIAPSCPQMLISNATKTALGRIASSLIDLPVLRDVLRGQEDCLTVSVQRPAGTRPDTKLPVLFWIFGGGFELGGSNTYDATSLLAAAVGDGMPFVYVAVNYRVGGFGFLPGAEIHRDGSANAGLLDQRMALEWVADNVAYFGGDPDKVTLWGESAGSFSVAHQMVLFGGSATYKGKPLFRGALMDSGSFMPADAIDCPKGQAVYNAVVRAAGCAGADDTLACLRSLDYGAFYEAATSVPSWLSFSSTALSYLPRPDGNVLPASAEDLVAAGRYHAVPLINGDQEDEGTLFSLFQQSIKTDDDLVDYFSTLYFQNATKDQLRSLVDMYPSDFDGSPFRTGSLNVLYPNFKRIAAMIGDLVFTLPRRQFLELATHANPDVPTWSYLSSYAFGLPVLGTFHASDLVQVFYGVPTTHATLSCRRYYFNFIYDLDPNKGKGGYSHWPMWKEKRTLMWFKTQFSNDYLTDDFRSDAYAVFRKLGSVLRL